LLYLVLVQTLLQTQMIQSLWILLVTTTFVMALELNSGSDLLWGDVCGPTTPAA
jgi:hypothetical protein